MSLFEDIAKIIKERAGAQSNGVWTPTPATTAQTSGSTYQDAVNNYVLSGYAKNLLPKMHRYAQTQDGQQDVLENLTSPQTFGPQYGDEKSYSPEAVRTGLMDRYGLLGSLGKMGVFDNRQTALGGYHAYSSTDYLKNLLEQLGGELDASKQKDAEWDATGRDAWYDYQTRNSAIANKLAEMDAQGRNYYDKDVLEESDLLWFDQVVNGNQRWKPNPGLQEDVDRINALIDQWAETDWETFNLADYLGIEAPQEYKSDTDSIQYQMDKLQRELDSRAEIERLTGVAQGLENFEELSQYVATQNPGSVYGVGNDAFRSALYDWVNTNGGQGEFAGQYVPADLKNAWSSSGYDWLFPDELKKYNALYRSGDIDGAMAYLNALESRLLQRRADFQAIQTGNYATANWLTAGLSFAGAGLSFLGNALNTPLQMIAAAGGNLDPNDPLFDYLRHHRTVGSSQGQYIEDNTDFEIAGTNVAKFVYDAFSSIRDTGVSLAAGTATGGVTGLPQYAGAISMLIQGSNAASDTLQKDIEAGWSPLGAVLHSLAVGGVEALTEKYSIDAILADPKTFTKALLKSMGTEAMEEGASHLLDPVAEKLVAEMTGNYDSWEAQAYDLVAAKKYANVDEAMKAIVTDWAKQLPEAMLIGAISGGVLGGTSAGIQIGQDVGAGKSVQKNGDVDALISIGSEMAPDSDSYQAAQELMAQQEAGKKLSLRNIGKLVNSLTGDIKGQAAETVKKIYEESITKRLVELGEDFANATNLASALRKIANGETLTVTERGQIAWSDAADQVAKELLTETKAGDEQRVGHSWKEDIAGRVGSAMAEAQGKIVQAQNAMNAKTRAKEAAAKAAEETAKKADATATEVDKSAKEMVEAGKDKLEGASENSVAYETEDGNEGTGELVRFEQAADGNLNAVVKAQGADGKATETKVSIKDIYGAATEAVASVADFIKRGIESGRAISATEASSMLNMVKQAGEDVQSYVSGFQRVYDAGYSGLDMPATTMDAKLAQIIYDQGKAEGVAYEETRVKKASKVRANSAGVVTWLGQVSSDADVKGFGSADGLNEALGKMTSMQRSVVKIVQAYAQKFKTNVVLFESGADGIGRVQNGSYDPNTNTLYIDINSGANTAADIEAGKAGNTLGAAVLRTLGHELTHHLESTSTAAYANFKQAVKNELKKAGKDWATLVRSKIDAAHATGRKISYAAAESEVVADASEFMLQNTKFAQEIDESTRGKVKKFIQNFMQKLSDVFRNITGAHDETRAIRKLIRGVWQYTGDLQKLWDAAMDESIGSVQEGAVVASNDVVDALYETGEIYSYVVQNSLRVRDEETIEYLENQQHITTYRAMQVIDGKLYPPMAEFIGSKKGGNREDPGILGQWEMAAEHPELIKWVDGKPKFELKKTNDDGSVSTVPAAYNPYMHSSNTVLNDQFSKAFQRNNLVVVECVVPVSESDGAYRAQYAKDATGWHEWKAGVVAGDLAKQKSGFHRDVFLSRYIKPVRILPDTEVAAKIAGYLDGTDVTVPFQSVWPTLRDALVKEGVSVTEPRGLGPSQMKIAKEAYEDWNRSNAKLPTQLSARDADYLSERFNAANEDIRYSARDTIDEYASEAMTTAADLQNHDGSRMFSLRSFTDDYDTYRDMLVKYGMDDKEITALFDTIDEVMKAIEKDREILDFGWNVGREDRSFNPVKQNSDQLYKVSIDFSTLCRKRLLQQAVQERLESMYNTVLTKAERVAIRNELMKLREEGKQIEVACALCYVESTRLKSPAQIQRFFDDRRAVMVDYFAKKNKEYAKLVNAKADELIVKFGHEPGTKKKELNTFQKNAVTNLKQSLNKAYKPSAEEEAIIAAAMSMPGESFKTEKGLWDLKREHEEIFDAYTSFVRNATKSKGIEGDEAWWAGDSESISDSLVESMNAENGLRTQSWSDFQVIHLLDYMAAIIELSTRNAKMQSYTKVPDFVNLMGDTGVMINLSLIPKGFDGTLNYDPIEGMPIDEALALRDRFPETAGTICIGITKKHIEMLLANTDIDYVIPYHSSSLDKKTRQQMGMKVWEDFQAYQNEKNKDYPNTDSKGDKYHKKPLFSEWFDYKTVSGRANELAAEAIAKLKNPTESQKIEAKRMAAEQAMKEAADRYKELCHQRGLQEKFEQFSGEPNYWKLLIDRKMINQKTGEIIEQKAVKPRFDKDRILNILSAEVNRFKEQNADKDAAVKHIVEAWENGEIRKAARSKKVRDQVSAFNDTVTVANIVASAEELDSQERVQMSIRDLPSEVTARELLADGSDVMAETVEEKNALSIYQRLLKEHAEASTALLKAEQNMDGKTGDELAAARKVMARARARQNDLYNRLLKVERTAHVQSVINRTNQLIADVSGKTETALAEEVTALEQKVDSLKADITGLKGAAKAQREADIRENERKIQQLKSNAAKSLLANSERYQRQIADIRARRDLNADIGKQTRHIKRIVKRLNDRIIHEEDYKNVKEPLKPAVIRLVREFIDGFGGTVFDTKTASELSVVYAELAKEGEAPEFYSNDVAEWLQDLASMKEWDALIRAEGSSSLSAAYEKLALYTRVAEIADHIYKMVKDADEVFINGKRESINAVSTETGTELLNAKDSKLLVGKARDAYNVFQNLIVKGNLTPQYFFESLKNSGLKRLFDGLMRGQREYAQAIRKGQEFVSDAKKRHNYYAWTDMHHPIEFTTEQGHKIGLTREQMLWVYATAKREATNKLMDTHHLDEGGFKYEGNALPRLKGKMQAIPGSDRLHKISKADVEKISAMLTQEQKDYADELVSYLSNECAAQGNKASMELFGIKKYNEEYYFPFRTDDDQRYQRSDSGSASTTNDARVKHASFTHSLRKGANTTLVMGDFTDVVSSHINLMATYSSFVVPIESMNRVLNAKVNDETDGSGNDVTIRSLVGRKHGEAAQKYIADLLKDLNGGPQVDSRGKWDAGIRLFKKNSVLGSLSVAVQQPTAYVRAFAFVDPKYFVHLTGERSKETMKRMMAYSGTAVLKEMGGFNVGMGKQAADWVANSDINDYRIFKRTKFLYDQKGLMAVKDNWTDFITALPGFMDRVTWSHIWKAVEAEQADLNPGMDKNSEAFLKVVGERFDDVVNHTQVYDSILAKSQNMRGKDTLAKMATAFMAEPTLNMNMYYSAFRGGHGKKQASRIVASVVLSNVLAAAAAAAVSAWNKDDDERTALEQYMTSFASRLADNLNPFGSIPYLSDIWSVMTGYEVERTDMSPIVDLFKYTTSFFDKVGDGKQLTWRDYENFLGSWANLTGIPFKNLSRDARRVRNLVVSDKSVPPASRVKYGVLDEIVPWRDTNNTAYYERYLAALKDGDKQEQYDLKDYLMSTKGVKEETITSGVRDAYKEEFLRGGIAKTDAISFLLENGLATGDTVEKKKQSAFQYVDRWSEGTDGYSAYNTLEAAFAAGNSAGIRTAWNELTSNGYTTEQVGEQSRKILKELVKGKKITPAKATEILKAWYPYKKDADNTNKPLEWLKETE